MRAGGFAAFAECLHAFIGARITSLLWAAPSKNAAFQAFGRSACAFDVRDSAYAGAVVACRVAGISHWLNVGYYGDEGERQRGGNGLREGWGGRGDERRRGRGEAEEAAGEEVKHHFQTTRREKQAVMR